MSYRIVKHTELDRFGNERAPYFSVQKLVKGWFGKERWITWSIQGFKENRWNFSIFFDTEEMAKRFIENHKNGKIPGTVNTEIIAQYE